MDAREIAGALTDEMLGHIKRRRENSSIYKCRYGSYYESDTGVLLGEILRLRAENEALKSKEVARSSADREFQAIADSKLAEWSEQIADLTQKLDEAEIVDKRRLQVIAMTERKRDDARNQHLGLTLRQEVLERQNAAMREALKPFADKCDFFVGVVPTQLVDICVSVRDLRRSVVALQPAPETPDADADTGTADDRLTHGFAVAADKILRDSTSAPQPGTAEWVKQQAAKLGITPAEWAKAYCDITPEQVRALRREQAISFAYGNVKMHNPDLTRETVAAEYDKLAVLHPAPEPKP